MSRIEAFEAAGSLTLVSIRPPMIRYMQHLADRVVES